MKKKLLFLAFALFTLPIAAQTEVNPASIIDSLNNEIDSLRSVIWDLRSEIYRMEREKRVIKGERLPYGSRAYDSPVSYEDKYSEKFRVFQALSGYALANERSEISFSESYYGKVVVLLGDYYDDQIVKIKQPMIYGVYSYTTKDNREKTVPIIVPKK